jgi:tetratricopeptide (TPR) repeat protein
MVFAAGHVATIWRRPFVAAAVIVVAGAAAYATTFHVPFLFDDSSSIVSNPGLRDLRAVFRAVFLSNRGLADLTFALNIAASGLAVEGFHLVNLLIHLAGGLVVHRLVLLTFATPFVASAGGGTHEGGRAEGVALVAALLFVLHPVQTGAVTYIVQRQASLATLLYVGALVLYASWRLGDPRQSARSWARWGGALLLTLLAMRTKEIAFTLPVVLLAWEFLFCEGDRRRRLLGLLPFLLMLAIIPATLLAAGTSLDDAKGVDVFAARAVGAAGETRWDYLLTQFRVVVTYLRLLLLPVEQTFDYDYPIERAFFTWSVLSSLALLLAVAAAGLAMMVRATRGDRRLRVAGFGVLWFFITLSVESTLIPIDDVIFEHRLYLPSVGFSLVVAAVLAIAWDRFAPSGGAGRPLLAAGFAAWLALLGGATFVRNRVWGDPITFFEDAAAKAPGKARPHLNLGIAYAVEGRMPEALREYEAAVRLNPANALAHYNLGHLYWRARRLDDAIREFEAVRQILPNALKTRNTLGRLQLEAGRLDDAEREFRGVLAMNPGYVEALQGLNGVLRERAARAKR